MLIYSGILVEKGKGSPPCNMVFYMKNEQVEVQEGVGHGITIQQEHKWQGTHAMRVHSQQKVEGHLVSRTDRTAFERKDGFLLAHQPGQSRLASPLCRTWLFEQASDLKTATSVILRSRTVSRQNVTSWIANGRKLEVMLSLFAAWCLVRILRYGIFRSMLRLAELRCGRKRRERLTQRGWWSV